LEAVDVRNKTSSLGFSCKRRACSDLASSVF
jgi:hypothetical protein